MLPGHDAAELLRVPREETECVGDLKDLINTKYELNVAPQHLVVYKLDGNIRILLNSMDSLSDAGIFQDTELSVERLVSAPAINSEFGVCCILNLSFSTLSVYSPLGVVEPLRFQRVVVGGVSMMLGWLLREEGCKKPIFLTIEEYGDLCHFLVETPHMDTPQLLVLLGTIKSGKSTLLEVVEPLVAALRLDVPKMQSRPPPVFFKFEFNQRCEAAAAASSLASALRDFAYLQGIALQVRTSDPLEHVAAVAEEVARGMRLSGRALWLLFDEAQGPILGSTVKDADLFLHSFKMVRTDATA